MKQPDENKNFDIDTLLDEVLIQEDLSKDNFEQTKVKSKQELAKDELFSQPLKIDLEQINKNMSAKPKKPKVEPKKVEENQTNQVKEIKQEIIDIDNTEKNTYTLEDNPNEKNYKLVLSKLVKDNEIKTKPFIVESNDEKGLLSDEAFIENKVSENDINNAVTSPKITVNANKERIISVRNYTSKTSIESTYNYLYINKALFAVLSSVSLIALIETAIMFFVINALNPIHQVYYFIAALIAIVPVGVGVFIYSFNPDKRVKRNFTYLPLFINSLIVTVILAMVLLIIILLTSISLTDPTDYVPKVLLPSLFILNYPIGVAMFLLFTKIKIFFVEYKYKKRS